jgi:pimeloyl-ACP methyl ester carboxylesterase
MNDTTLRTATLPVLHHAVRGSGAPLLLLNGIGLDLQAWGPAADLLARERRLVLADARGTGGSGPSPGPATTAGMAADALALLDHLGLERVDVLGLSLGGLVAQELALLAPGRVRALVLAATAARLPGRSRRALDAWRRLIRTGADADALRREQVAWVLGTATLEDDATTELVVGAMSGAPAPSPEGYSAQCDACLAHDSGARAPGIRAPALVLGGRDDALIPPGATEALARLLPRARLETLPGGHAFLLESAAPAAEAVLRFLREVDAREPTEVAGRLGRPHAMSA